MAADRILAGPIAAGNMHAPPDARSRTTGPNGRPWPPGAGGGVDETAADGLPVGLRTPDLPQYSSQRSAGGDVLGMMERQQAERPSEAKSGQGQGDMHAGQQGRSTGQAGYKGDAEKGKQVKGGCCVVM